MNHSLFSLVFLLSISTAQASEGGREGHGGGAYVCQTEQGRKVTSFDIEEGQSRYRFQANFLIGNSYEQYMTIALKRVREVMPSLAAKIEAELIVVDEKISQTEKDLYPTLDASRTLIDPNCRYAQVAVWDERTDRIDLDMKLYRDMSAFDQAALKFHEAIYRIDRLYGVARDSDDTRELVARIFMLQKVETKIAIAYQQPIIQSEETAGISPRDFRTTLLNKKLTVSWANARCYQSNRSEGSEEIEVTVKFLGGSEENILPWGASTRRVRHVYFLGEKLTPGESVSGAFQLYPIHSLEKPRLNIFEGAYHSSSKIEVSVTRPTCQETVTSVLELHDAGNLSFQTDQLY